MLDVSEDEPHFQTILRLSHAFNELRPNLRKSLESGQGSAQFIACNAASDHDARRWLAGEGNFDVVAGAYGDMNEEQQQDYLNCYAEQLGAAYGRHSGLALQPFHVVFVDGAEDGWRMNVAPDVIQINRLAESRVLQRNLPAAIASVTQGAAYQFCNELRRLRTEGQLPATHPLHDDAAVLSFPYEKKPSRYLQSGGKIAYLDDRVATTAMKSIRDFLEAGQSSASSHFDQWQASAPQDDLNRATDLLNRIEAGREEEALAKTLRAVKPSPEYRRRMIASLKEYGEVLKDSPRLCRAAHEPIEMDNPNHYPLMQTHINELKVILEKNFQIEIPGTTVTWLCDEGEKARLGTIVYLETIAVSPYAFENGKKKDREMVDGVGTGHHELVHQFHNADYDAIKMNRLPSDYPVMPDAAYYHQMRKLDAIICEPASAYRAQLDERMARVVSRITTSMINKAAKVPVGLPPQTVPEPAPGLQHYRAV